MGSDIKEYMNIYLWNRMNTRLKTSLVRRIFDLKVFSFINNLIFYVSEWVVKFSFIIYDRNVKLFFKEYTNNSGEIKKSKCRGWL